MRPWQKIKNTNKLARCFVRLFKRDTKPLTEQALYKPKFDEEQTWLGIG